MAPCSCLVVLVLVVAGGGVVVGVFLLGVLVVSTFLAQWWG